MVTIPGLSLILDADVNGDLEFPVHDPAETGNQGKRIKRSQILADYFASGDNATFGSLTLAAALSGTTATFTTVSFSTSFGFTGGATMTGLRQDSTDLTPSDITAGSNEDMTMTVTGAAIGDHVSLSFTTALPVGLIAQAWVSSDDTVTVRFSNVTASTILSATYTTSAVATRFS